MIQLELVRVIARYRGLAIHVLGRAVLTGIAVVLIAVALPAAIAAQASMIP